MAVRTIEERAAPVAVGDATLTPVSQSMVVDLPFAYFEWNRPTAVLVSDGEGERRIPVVDVTRLVQIALYGLALIFVLARVVSRKS